ncbi:hypothetical protein [Arthrobacter sp. B0490]|uniref:hypothetical protein n=1 Tax=Arthrobacter sp. B0490 TaxID=2058891 RepID=UPI0011AFE4AF|nr:hypothetical protein [Arthrobacter sp. B0490]
MSDTVLGSAALSRLCPGPPHRPGSRRHCAGKHCVEDRGGLLVLWWAPGSLLAPTDVLGSYDGVRDLSDGHRMPLVVHLQGLVGIAPQARSLLLEASLASRIALVGTGPVDQVIAGFLEQALSETQYFESAPEAMAWARSP